MCGRITCYIRIDERT